MYAYMKKKKKKKIGLIIKNNINIQGKRSI